ncbi:MAG: hypothetical protein R3C12_08765 [Planctomycetaceae bacterium]
MMRSTTQPFAWAMISAAVLAMSGCAAFRPIPGIPASALPPEYHAVSRADESTIDLSLLAQVPPHQHYVDGGDVLGIYIEGVLGRPGERRRSPSPSLRIFPRDRLSDFGAG